MAILRTHRATGRSRSHKRKVHDLGDEGCTDKIRRIQSSDGNEDSRLAYIFRLPVELIHAISFLADHDTLHRLTCVSRYLSECLIPVFLENQGFMIPDHSRPISTVHAANLSETRGLQVWRRSSHFKSVGIAFIYLSPEISEARIQARCLCSVFSFAAPSITQHLYIHLDCHTTENILILRSISGFESVHISAPAIQDPHSLKIVDLSKQRPYLETDHTQLKSLDVRTPILFTATFGPWMSKILHRHFLSVLDLQKLSLSPSHWRDLLQPLDIPTVTQFCVAGDATLHTLCSFFQRHPNLRNIFIAASRLRTTTSIRRLPLPYLQELHGPFHLLRPFLAILQLSAPLASLSIFPAPTGLCPRELGHFLEHPTCLRLNLKQLEVAFKDLATSDIIFDSISNPQGLATLYSLTITHGLKEFIFTGDALANVVKWGSHFPSLRVVSINDSSYHDRKCVIDDFARSLRESSEQLRQVRVWYNFEQH